MPSAKEQIAKILQDQPDDSSYDEILRELAFARMIDSGLADSDEAGRHQPRRNGPTHQDMAELTWTAEAERWLRDIHDYIAQDNPAAATRTVEALYQKAEVLREFPESGYRYWQRPDRHIRILLHGHYRIAYVVNN